MRSAWVDAGADHGLDDAGVGGQPRQHFARAGDLEEAGRQLEDVAVDVAPQVGHDALAQPGDQIGPQVGRHRQGHDNDADGLDRMVERAGVALREAAIDQVAQADAQGEHGGGGEDEGEQRADDVAAIWSQIGGKPTQLAEVAAPVTLGPEPCQ